MAMSQLLPDPTLPPSYAEAFIPHAPPTPPPLRLLDGGVGRPVRTRDEAPAERPSGESYALRDVCFDATRRLHRWLSPIARHYFRAETRRMDRIPDSSSILVTHHDGGMLPFNGMCFALAWHDHHAFRRPLYILAHDVIHATFRFLEGALPRLGIVPADRPVMDAVLERSESVLVFPGAARESFRTYADRANIDLGQRLGFVRQALRHRRPIVPFVSAGAHETLFVLARGQGLARWLGMPKLVRSADILPLCVGLPWGIWAVPALPQFPLPAKVTTEVLEPIELRGNWRDEVAVRKGFETVLGEMRRALKRLYAERRYPVIG